MARKMSKPYNTGLVLVKSESWIEKPKNKKKKGKSSVRASKGKIQEEDPFRPRQKNRGLAGQKKKKDRDAFRFSNRKQEKKKAKNRRDKNKTPRLGLQNKQPDKVKRNKKRMM